MFSHLGTLKYINFFKVDFRCTIMQMLATLYMRVYRIHAAAVCFSETRCGGVYSADIMEAARASLNSPKWYYKGEDHQIHGYFTFFPLYSSDNFQRSDFQRMRTG